MPEPRRINRVHRSLSRPLTILGAERKLFFFRHVPGRGHLQSAEQPVRGVADVSVALFPGPLGHPNRPADTAFSADGRKAAPAVRPDEIQPRFECEGTAMLRLSRIFKNYNETGSLSEQINLYGFIGPHVFLTKSGEVGVILEVRGVDYECLDDAVD